jgi:hypothetical protein
MATAAAPIGPPVQVTGRVKSTEGATRCGEPLPPGLACATLQQMTQTSEDIGPIPPARKDDSEDVAWALSTAEAMHARGDRGDALKWLRRAAEAASEAQSDDRALELAKAAADLASLLSPTSNAPPPPPPLRATSIVPMPHPATAAPEPPSSEVPRTNALSSPPASHPPIVAAPPDPPSGSPATEQLLAPLLPEAEPERIASKSPELEMTPLHRPVASPLFEDPASEEPPSERDTRPGLAKSPVQSDDAGTWLAGALLGNDLTEPPDEKTRIGVPAYAASAKLATESTEDTPAPPLSAAPQGAPDPVLRPSQALRVVVWRAVDGVHVAPQGTRVAAISVDALLVALDPGADLAAWLSGS